MVPVFTALTAAIVVRLILKWGGNRPLGSGARFEIGLPHDNSGSFRLKSSFTK